MAKRLRLVDETPAVDVRAELVEHFRSAARRARMMCRDDEAVLVDRREQQLVADLEVGLPVVVYSWELAGLDLPNVRRGVHAMYRVECDGRVVQLVPRRDPRDPLQITGWDVKR